MCCFGLSDSGSWTEAQALTAVVSTADPLTRGRKLMGLAPHLTAVASDMAREVALRSLLDAPPSPELAIALAQLTSTLPPAEAEAKLGQAREAANSLKNLGDRARALAGIAPYLPAPERRRTVDAAMSLIREPMTPAQRIPATLEVLPLLLAEDRAAAIEYVANSAGPAADRRERLDLLSQLLPALNDSEREVIVGEAVSELPFLDTVSRAQIAGRIGPYLPQTQHKALIGETLSTIPGAVEPSARARALASLAPHLDGAAQARAVEEHSRQPLRATTSQHDVTSSSPSPQKCRTTYSLMPSMSPPDCPGVDDGHADCTGPLPPRYSAARGVGYGDEDG